jgi:hypothetical protein
MIRLNHVVLYVATNAVLRTKECAKIDVGMFVKEIGSMLVAVVDRGLIANETDARAFIRSAWPSRSFQVQVT